MNKNKKKKKTKTQNERNAMKKNYYQSALKFGERADCIWQIQMLKRAQTIWLYLCE